MPEAGEILGGRYRLEYPLGEGGMATIWAAEHMSMGNLVAVKIISADLVDNELALTRFTREARAAAQLRSPYVVQLFDHDVDPLNGPYIAMELLEGENLADRLDREGVLPSDDLCRIIQQVCKGLTKAHAADIVHRDMKPDNIFLAVDDDAEETAKILDFGVAKADSPFMVRSKKTVEGALVGTLSYMSPEQAQGREVDLTTDLWALGVIAFEALVGDRPFDDEAPGAVVMKICAYPIPVPSKWNPKVPPGFDEWFLQACNRDPAKRFKSAAELSRALVEACEASELSPEDVLDVELEITAEKPVSAEKEPPPIPPAEIKPAPVEAEPAAKPKRKRGVKNRKSKPVLQIVESEPPPPKDDDEDEIGVDIEFEVAPEFYVSDGTLTVGPIGLETVRVGYHEGYVAVDAMLWTAGWPSWRPALDVFERHPELRKKRVIQDLELIGPSCEVPVGAPGFVNPQAPKRGSKKRGARKQAIGPMPPKPPSRKPPPPKLPELPPPNPPPPKPANRRSSPVSEVRDTPPKPRAPELGYYLMDGAITVGPIRASLLRRGLDAGTIPDAALAWRMGWDAWRPVSATLLEIENAPMAPKGMLRSRPGIESVGFKAPVPSAAPPLDRGKSGQRA